MKIYDLSSEVIAFSTTRHGGCSVGNYASMNCTPYTGDDIEAVQSNQTLLCTALHLPKERLVIPYQTHGVEVRLIDDTFLKLSNEERYTLLQGVDALVSAEPNICLCVSTADCIPILLFDKKHRVVAAVHAGWRGTVNSIVSKVLTVMQQTYGSVGENLMAVIGPGISLQAFEVGEEVYEAFEQAAFPMDSIACWHADTHKWHIDLPAANVLQLLNFGVAEQQILQSGICTYASHEDFFSARRLGIKSGRILSGIIIKE